jgi:CRISPR-associated protein Csb2
LRDEFGNEPPMRARPQVAVYHGYTTAPPLGPSEGATGTAFGPHLTVFRLEPAGAPAPRSLDLATSPAVAARWRAALVSESNDLSATARCILSGHDAEGGLLDDAHLAFVPLAFVGHKHADGRLLGMGLALPGGLEPADRRGVMRAIGRVRELKLGRLGLWALTPVTESRPPHSMRSDTWTAWPDGARQWSTVTPIAFDRHPKAKARKAQRVQAADLIRQNCGRVGLPEPGEVIVTNVSTHLGVPPSREFPRLHRKDGSARRHTHAILIFDEPVVGPILLGAGRYRGYGVCRALDGDG